MTPLSRSNGQHSAQPITFSAWQSRQVARTSYRCSLSPIFSGGRVIVQPHPTAPCRSFAMVDSLVSSPISLLSVSVMPPAWGHLGIEPIAQRLRWQLRPVKRPAPQTGHRVCSSPSIVEHVEIRAATNNILVTNHF